MSLAHSDHLLRIKVGPSHRCDTATGVTYMLRRVQRIETFNSTEPQAQKSKYKCPLPQVWQENKYSWRPGMEGHLLFNKAVTKRTNPIPQWVSQAIESRRGWRMTVSRGRLCVQSCQQGEVTHQRWSALSPRPTLPTSNITVTFLFPTINLKAVFNPMK